KAAELMAGISLGQRHRSLGRLIAGKDPRALRGIENIGIQPQFFSQLTVELNQSGLRHLRRLPGHVEAVKFARIGIVEGKSRGGRVVRDLRHRVTFLARKGDGKRINSRVELIYIVSTADGSSARVRLR